MLDTEKIKERMKEKKITQREMADVLGIAPPTVSQKINGIRPMDLEEARKFADKLEITPAEFGEYFFAQKVAQRNNA